MESNNPWSHGEASIGAATEQPLAISGLCTSKETDHRDARPPRRIESPLMCFCGVIITACRRVSSRGCFMEKLSSSPITTCRPEPAVLPGHRAAFGAVVNNTTFPVDQLLTINVPHSCYLHVIHGFTMKPGYMDVPCSDKSKSRDS